MTIKIRARYLTKEYEMMRTKSDKIKSLISSKKIDKFWALKGISFDIYEGDSVGIVGMNGSGKSTLLNIVSEIIPPTSGELEINGTTNIISVGAGLNLNLTGRENIQMKCEMLGMSSKEIEETLEKIIDFAGDQVALKIDQPVKTYSSGMRSRLGFSILVHQEPDILIIDEALSVGDKPFFEKGVERMKQFKEDGKTILFVSHSLTQVKELCDKVIWIDNGEIVQIGETEEVLKEYGTYQRNYNKMKKFNKEEQLEQFKKTESEFRLSKLEEEHKEEPKEYFQRKVYDKPYSMYTQVGLIFLMWLLLKTVYLSINQLAFRGLFKVGNPIWLNILLILSVLYIGVKQVRRVKRKC